MKRIALFLTLVLLITASTSSFIFAADLKVPENTNKNQMKALSFEEVIALTPEANLKVVEQSSQRKVMNIDWTNGLHATAIKTTLKNGNIQLEVIEGNLNNILVYQPNGDLYLNGSKVIYSDQNNISEGINQVQTKQLIGTSDITPMQMATFHTGVPLVGVASDYSVADSVKSGSVLVDAAICNVGITVFTAILGGIAYLAYSVTVAVIVSGLYDVYKAKKVTATSIWYKTTIKKYKNNGPATYAFKYSSQFGNQTGSVTYGTPKVEYYTYVI